MAYNFYNVGIIGPEVQRRLDMLKDIKGTNGVASKVDIETTNTNLNANVEALNITIAKTQVQLNNEIQSAINLNKEDGIAYINAGTVLDFVTSEPDEPEPDEPELDEPESDENGGSDENITISPEDKITYDLTVLNEKINQVQG